jgi:hypothetical protein
MQKTRCVIVYILSYEFNKKLLLNYETLIDAEVFEG